MLIFKIIMYPFFLAGLYAHQRKEDAYQRKLKECREQENREIEARSEARRAAAEQLMVSWDRPYSVDEKYEFICNIRDTETPYLWHGPYFPRALPPEMEEWWNETGKNIEGWRNVLQQYTKAKALIEENGVIAIRHGPHRKELQCILRRAWHNLSQPKLIAELDSAIEYYSRCLDGEDPDDIRDDLEWRKEREAAERKRSPELADDESTVTLAERLRKLPRVQSMQARIEKTPDGKSVLFFLNLSQHERAIVADNGLDEIVYDDEPAHTKEELDAMQASFDEEVDDIQEDEEQREEIAERRREISAEMRALKAKRKKYTLIEFLRYPFEKEFASRHEATLYADKLQKIVEKVRSDIKKYENVGDTRIFKGDDEE